MYGIGKIEKRTKLQMFQKAFKTWTYSMYFSVEHSPLIFILGRQLSTIFSQLELSCQAWTAPAPFIIVLD